MKNDMDTQFLCKDCERYNLCEYYDGRKETSYICKFFHIEHKEELREIRQKIDGLRYDHLIGNVSNYAVIDVALEIIDAHIAEEHE